MLIKISLVITMILYSLIVCESFFYRMALSGAIKKMRAAVFIETKKLIDRELQTSLVTVYYMAIAFSIALTAFCVVNPNGLLFICSVISLLILLIDLLLLVTGILPLNKMINTWTTTDYPDNWETIHSKWSRLIYLRHRVNITGFIILLTGTVFGL